MKSLLAELSSGHQFTPAAPAAAPLALLAGAAGTQFVPTDLGGTAPWFTPESAGTDIRHQTAEDLRVVFARHHNLRPFDEGGEEPVELLDVHRPAPVAALEEVCASRQSQCTAA